MTSRHHVPVFIITLLSPSLPRLTTALIILTLCSPWRGLPHLTSSRTGPYSSSPIFCHHSLHNITRLLPPLPRLCCRRDITHPFSFLPLPPQPHPAIITCPLPPLLRLVINAGLGLYLRWLYVITFFTTAPKLFSLILRQVCVPTPVVHTVRCRLSFLSSHHILLVLFLSFLPPLSRFLLSYPAPQGSPS